MKKFSVLMSVYYKENPNYLDQALTSIFDQTLLPNEVVLVEDGKLTKELDEIIDDYIKKYSNIIKVVKYSENRGLGIALHDGILECSNELIFRMDTDDICDKERFEKQMKIFEKNNYDVIGSNIAEYDENMKKVISYRVVPQNDIEIKKMLKKRNSMNHVTVLYKKSKVLEADNYQNMPYFEDYYLWARMAKKGCIFYNIQENLVKVRCGNDMMKRRGGKKYIKPIINFEKSILKLGLINRFQYIYNTMGRIAVSIVPNWFRTFVYSKILRKK